MKNVARIKVIFFKFNRINSFFQQRIDITDKTRKRTRNLYRKWVLIFDFKSIIPQRENCDQYQKECKVFATKAFLPEIIWFADVPILKRDRPAVRHPEEGSFLSLIGAGCPKVFMTKTEVLDVLLKPVVLLLWSYTR